MSMLLLLLLFATPPGTAGWTLFRGDPQLTGRAQGELPAKPAPLWTFRAGKGFSSTAAISGGADGTVYAASLDGHLYALDLATGKVRWKHKAADQIKSSPSVREGTVYFGDEKGTFYALDAKTGKVRWTFQAEGPIVSSANFAGNCVLFGSYDQFLYCLSPKNGSVLWKVETEGYVHGTPAVSAGGDTVISAGCDGILRVLRVKDGSEVRRVPLGGYAAASPALSGGKAFLGNFENQFLGVDWQAGKVLWKYEHPVRKFPFYSSAGLAGNTVVVGGRDQMIHALDAATGRELWSWSAKSAIDASPVVAGNRVVAGAKNGAVFALDVKTGQPVWRFEAGAPVEASPAVGAGRLVIGAMDGTLYCFGAK